MSLSANFNLQKVLHPPKHTPSQLVRGCKDAYIISQPLCTSVIYQQTDVLHKFKGEQRVASSSSEFGLTLKQEVQ